MSVFDQDDEAFAIWRDEIGVPVAQIQRLGEKDNFWCGPRRRAERRPSPASSLAFSVAAGPSPLCDAGDCASNCRAAGPTGPCGPCSELYFDFHPERGTKDATVEDDSRFIEFYNLVFMEFSRGGDGKLTPLANKNIDTGMGLERMAQILQGVPNNYETDLIFPIIQKAAEARFALPPARALAPVPPFPIAAKPSWALIP